MLEVTSNPLFGLVLSIFMYLLGVKINQRYPHPLTTPLLFATVGIIIFLKLTGISYEEYYKGGSMLNTLIAPSTVALGLPLYKTLHLMKHHFRSIMLGIGIGAVVNVIATAIFARFFGLEKIVALSIFPKSVTTAMAVGISEKMSGIATITLVSVVATGILTSVIGANVLKWFKIEDPVAQGIALGGTGHAIGTGKAMELGKVQGAMSGLSIGITGVVYVVVAPLIANIFLS
ncbi:TIGR00659 family protein [Pilibacter termitis]|uniref:TIGR00659 family protein n=1 Tax=Pilibacter termitis TaxID=263852 RepID=A0A1T4QKA7_9ENTE|nr:LrgB family protein [Pilibacter termitis]SKA03688.1 TIGR00659 family protein [Pilibacter termitis]